MQPIHFWRVHLHLAALVAFVASLLYTFERPSAATEHSEQGWDATLAALLAAAGRCLDVLVDGSAAPDAQYAAGGCSTAAHAWLPLLDLLRSSGSRIGRGSLSLDGCSNTAQQALRHVAALAPPAAAGQLPNERGSMLTQLLQRCCAVLLPILKSAGGEHAVASSSTSNRLQVAQPLHTTLCRLINFAAGHSSSSSSSAADQVAAALNAESLKAIDLLCNFAAHQLELSDAGEAGVAASMAAAQCEAALSLANIAGGVDTLVSRVRWLGALTGSLHPDVPLAHSSSPNVSRRVTCQ